MIYLANRGNGLTTSKYSWIQSLKEVTLTIKLSLGTRTKDLICEIKPQHIKVSMKGQEPILDGKLPARVIVDESLWELSEESDHKLLTIELLKENQSEWWNRIADGEPIINTSKVEPEESKLSDLDGEMRSTVEKMMVYILYY